MSRYIQLQDCRHGGVYVLDGRNLNLGVYDESEKKFIGIRTKFSSRFLCSEIHYDACPHNGTTHPTKFVCTIPPLIQIGEYLRDGVTGSTSWLEQKGGTYVPIIRRDLDPTQPPHGTRQGFEDLYVDGTRIPDKSWPILRMNRHLFDYLSTQEADLRDYLESELDSLN